ncbi:hypothetical protein [Ornithinimicrobium sufpigmenti]|uniref:hypothetical protein n=1 Tax=Ornithinimicrobium sufpigmenti TaxID=2508882 RepID=UPI0015E1A950|nr:MULTISPECIES: hypothetical protein [unclassified Ornithinimicrobium]
MDRTPTDIAWCAGFYEGEGTVIYGAAHNGPLRIKISSTDRDVLDLMAARSGVGSVNGPYSPRGFGKKPFFQWVANGHEAVGLLRDMLPLLGERRAARAVEKIALWEQRPVRQVADKAAMRADRASGMTYADIGRKHGVSHARAYQVCRDGERVARRWAVAPAE